MAATSTRHATATTAAEVMPACPACASSMVVRAQWSGGRVNGLYWGCRRAPGCEGTRRIKNPEQIRPLAHDASAQAIFDWEASHERREVGHRSQATALPAPSSGLRGLFGRVLSRESDPAIEMAEPAEGEPGSLGYFDSLVEHGFVVLEDRSLAAARAHIDTVVVGPSGIFLVDHKSWPGQVMTSADTVYVDGRQRVGATDNVLRATAAFDETLGYELKPLGVSARPAVLFDRATNRSFEAQAGGVMLGGTRALPKLIRGRGEPVLGPETIVRLAVAADRLLD